MKSPESDYQTLTERAGCVPLKNRTLVALRGADRGQLLQSFCTANIKSLEIGQTTEAFILNGKGKILAHVLVLALPDELLLSGTPGMAKTIIDHLDRYIIREDVTLVDLSADWSALFVLGAESQDRLGLLLENLPEPNTIAANEIAGNLVQVAAVEIAGAGYLALASIAAIDQTADFLNDNEILACGEMALQRIRIEQGTPWYGIDIDDRNLPQELQRDDKALSFTKGCYLGQETVARIDARGHVNQLWVGLHFPEASKVDPGTELVLDGKTVGRVTSACAAGDQGWIGRAYIKKAQAKTGTRLEISGKDFAAWVS